MTTPHIERVVCEGEAALPSHIEQIVAEADVDAFLRNQEDVTDFPPRDWQSLATEAAFTMLSKAMAPSRPICAWCGKTDEDGAEEDPCLECGR